MKRLILLGVTLLSLVFLQDGYAQAHSEKCSLKGNVFVESKRNMAQYIVYEEKNEGMVDVRVFKEENSLFADKSGKWHFVNARGLADFTIFFEKEKNLADFSIMFIETEAFAGCN